MKLIIYLKKQSLFLLSILIVFTLSVSSSIVLAHERWVPHQLLYPVQASIFSKISWDMMSVIGRTVILFIFMGIIWKIRHKIFYFILKKGNKNIFWSKLKGFFQFFLDYPCAQRWFCIAGKLVQKLAMRTSSLALMYSAANGNLLMPSFPLPHSISVYLQFFQALLGLLIIMELALPFVGYSLFFLCFTCLILYGPIVTIDALPILAIAYVYITMPNLSKRSDLVIRQSQIQWMRIILGFSFLMLGIMKIYNHNLMLGVIDNKPSLMSDFVLQFFTFGTDPAYRREWFTFGFGISEILTGVLLMSGMFVRLISLFTTFIFTKLMVYNFGWAEVPHIYPISILLLLCFSKILYSEEILNQRRRKKEKVYN